MLTRAPETWGLVCGALAGCFSIFQPQNMSTTWRPHLLLHRLHRPMEKHWRKTWPSGPEWENLSSYGYVKRKKVFLLGPKMTPLLCITYLEAARNRAVTRNRRQLSISNTWVTWNTYTQLNFYRRAENVQCWKECNEVHWNMTIYRSPYLILAWKKRGVWRIIWTSLNIFEHLWSTEAKLCAFGSIALRLWPVVFLGVSAPAICKARRTHFSDP